jgi:MFS transporter, DHA1 family, tetracycline resistance protein
MLDKSRKSPLIFVLLTTLIDTMGFGIIVPVLPELIMQVGHVDVAGSARLAGLLLVVFAALQFLFSPVMGNLSDRYGRRPVMLISLLAFSVNYAIMGFAPSLAWLFVGRALTGMSGAIYGPANAYVADVTPPEKRAQNFSLIGASFGLGFVLGPALGGLLGEAGARAPFFAAAGLALLNFVYGFFVLPESLPPERRRPFSLRRANPLGALRAFRSLPGVLGLAFTAFLWQLAFHVYPATWSFYTIAKFDLSPAAIGGTLALSGLAMALVQSLLTGRIVTRIGERRAAPLGMITGFCVFIAYAFATESWMLYPLLVIGGFQGISMPSINAMMSQKAGSDRQGELQGGVSSLMALGAIVGPVSMTQTLAAFSGNRANAHFPGAAFLLAAALTVLALTSLMFQLRKLPAPSSA